MRGYRPRHRPARIFIAGPLRSDRPSQVAANLATAQRMALDLVQLGTAPYCPHANLGHGLGVLDETAVEIANQTYLRLADAVVLLPGWRRSAGTKVEMMTAHKLAIPIFDGLAGIKAWLERWRP